MLGRQGFARTNKNTYVYSLMMSTYCWLSSAARSEAPSRYVAFELSHDAHGEISRQFR